MPNPDIDRWNRKYSAASNDVHQADQELLPRGEPELIAHSGYLSGSGLALELASGKGRNAMHLAELGYKVIAADCAFNGLFPGQQAANQRNLDMHSLVCDLETYRFPPNRFDLVSVVRFLQRPLFDEIAAWIRPGGLLFYKTFNRNFLIDHPRFNPDYVVEDGELERAFGEFTILASDMLTPDTMSVEKTGSGTSFILARKPSA